MDNLRTSIKEIISALGIYKLLDYLEPKAERINKRIESLLGRQQ